MAEKYHLSFSIGPVQAFVTQARRTRDLWVGSVLLSWLAESALVAVENEFEEKFEQGTATTILPDRSGIRGKLTSIESGFGGIPNRFEIEFESANDAARSGTVAQQGFQNAWQTACDAVWMMIGEAEQSGNATENIWKRQTESFWELSWIVASPSGRSKTIGDMAAARKLIRNVPVTEEGGVKCSLMHEWQELSGYERRDDQTAFWNAVRRCSGVGTLDLRDGERLCAMALIKRLLPAVDTQVFGRSFQQKNWPSTAFLAAMPWLHEVQQNPTARAAADAYVAAARKAGVCQSEVEAAKDAEMPWARIDAPAWFTTSIHNNEWLMEQSDTGMLIKQLDDLYRVTAGRKPIPFYALLLMDGDSMGSLLHAIKDPTALSQCLSRFTSGVNQAVKEHGGRTVYAGGDDVLALLPATETLAIADRLSHEYQRSFVGVLEDTSEVQATISAAIVYAHWKQPLRQVLQHAHRLLDDVAKNATGRDAVAIGIVKGSGLNAQWAVPWKTLRELKMIRGDESIIHRFQESPSGDAEKKPVFNASFLCHLRDQFARLIGRLPEQPGSFGLMHDNFQANEKRQDILLALANSEYRRRLSSEDRTQSLDETREFVRPLVELTRHVIRGEQPDTRKVGFDGWRVARFLKQVDDGEMQDHE
ncbi:type III-B CRISPR-associated protein Cas10/Cmr2 [Allorhodopirellula heiligendammensis]|uniref:CRISPR-associated protein n=1 Tax=Allorhodopirellula heiligendammensis TaxID=2714739 RepID=A0A5C6C1E0_9BACT|nr:type III-B CRISPR-associated protein Cas10/Cmr2 [Allorhodopirellula heiligendammensis]TWU17952.1 CRISPR-associated protein [Allorhodopirellula heiligendammensis]